MLIACYTSEGARYCLVQLLEAMDSFGTTIQNEFECPLYTLINVFRSVPSKCIQHSVSVIHECTQSCTFKQGNIHSNIERETVVVRKLHFEHDYTNTLFFININLLYALSSLIFVSALYNN